MADTPILDIATITAPAAFLKINRVRYFFRSVDALSLKQIAILKRDGPRLGNLLIRAEELTDDESTETSHLLDAFCMIVLDAPADVQAKLHDQQRVAIVEAFTKLWPTPTLASAPTTRANRTGAKRSLGSNASTAATPSAG
jgi:hypothetical protein